MQIANFMNYLYNFYLENASTKWDTKTGYTQPNLLHMIIICFRTYGYHMNRAWYYNQMIHVSYDHHMIIINYDNLMCFFYKHMIIICLTYGNHMITMPMHIVCKLQMWDSYDNHRIIIWIEHHDMWDIWLCIVCDMWDIWLCIICVWIRNRSTKESSVFFHKSAPVWCLWRLLLHTTLVLYLSTHL